MKTECLMRAVIVAVLLNGFLPLAAFGAGKAEHVVVVVWDGMRPDFITERDTPTLHYLAQAGVFFLNHHPVFLSATEVNGAAIATGAYPVHSGIMANKEYRPAINLLAPEGTESSQALREGDRLSKGHYLNRLTIAEILHDAGHTTAVAGTKPVWGRSCILTKRSRRIPGSNWSRNSGHTRPAPVRTPDVINGRRAH